MNSEFWLVPQSLDIKYYSPPGGFRVKKMSRETHFIRKWSNFLGIAIKLVLYILKQLFASVPVTTGGDLPRRSGSANIHCYSPPLLRIIVNYLLRCVASSAYGNTSIIKSRLDAAWLWGLVLALNHSPPQFYRTIIICQMIPSKIW